MRLPSSSSSRLLSVLATTAGSVLFLVALAPLGACSGEATTSPVVPAFEGGAGDANDPHGDGSAGASSDAPVEAAVDASASTPSDAGPPAMRNASCTPLSDQTGTAVTSPHGRLDGTLVYVIPPGQGKACNGDDSHVHLQVLVSGSVYDIAVDIGTAPNDEVGLYEDTMTVPDGTFAEGWHGSDDLSYPSLGVHSTSFTTQGPVELSSQVESLLAATSSISIFCTGYSQENGCHDVHYEDGTGKDGAILLNPTGATSPVLFFRFATQTF